MYNNGTSGGIRNWKRLLVNNSVINLQGVSLNTITTPPVFQALGKLQMLACGFLIQTLFLISSHNTVLHPRKYVELLVS